jgi:hypothetical protein
MKAKDWLVLWICKDIAYYLDITTMVQMGISSDTAGG